MNNFFTTNAYVINRAISTLETASDTPCPIWVAVILGATLLALIVAMIVIIIKSWVR